MVYALILATWLSSHTGWAVTDPCFVTFKALGIPWNAVSTAQDLAGLALLAQSEHGPVRGLVQRDLDEKVGKFITDLQQRGIDIERDQFEIALKTQPAKANHLVNIPKGSSLPDPSHISLMQKKQRLGGFQNRHAPDPYGEWIRPKGNSLILLNYHKIKTAGHIRSSPTVLPDGNLVFASEDGFLYKVTFGDPGQPPSVYKVNVGSPIDSTATVLPNGNFVVGSQDGNLHYFAVDVGHPLVEVNKVHIGGPLSSSAAVLPDETIVVGSGDRYVYHLGLDPSGNLREISKALTNGRVFSSPAVLPNGSVVVGSEDGHLYHFGVDPDGKLQELSKSGTGPISASPTVLANGDIIVGCEDGWVYQFRIDRLGTLSQIRASMVGGKITSSASPLSDLDFAVGSEVDYDYNPHSGFVEPYGGYLHHFRIGSDGIMAPSEKAKASANVTSSPVVLPNGDLVAGSLEGTLHRFRLGMNRKSELIVPKIGRNRTNGAIYSSPTLLANGDIAVGSDDGYLYLFRLAPKPGIVERFKTLFGRRR